MLELKELGRHYEEEGVKVLDKILSTMNRLSTTKKEAIDLDLLTKDINSLLSRPSNLEIREDGRIFIKSPQPTGSPAQRSVQAACGLGGI